MLGSMPAPAGTAKRVQALQIAMAVAGALVLAEILTLHSFIKGWVRKGNIPDWYYWTFQLVLAIVFAVSATRTRVTRRPALFVVIGAGIGYIVSFAVSLIAWFGSLGELTEAMDRLRPLGVGAVVELSLLTPLILLGPVLGVLPVVVYLLLDKLQFLHV